MTQKELEDYLWGAANILRGMIDAADFKQYIFPLCFSNGSVIYGMKSIKPLWMRVVETLTMHSLPRTIGSRFLRDAIGKMSERKLLMLELLLQKALNEIEKANFEMLHDVFGDAQWTNKRRMSDEKMLDLIEHFSQMNLSVAECTS